MQPIPESSLTGQNTFPFQISVPVGSVIAFAGKIINPSSPEGLQEYKSQIEAFGWMLCDGRELEISKYPELFLAIGYLYSQNQSGNKFMLPDFRGCFLMGVDDGFRTALTGGQDRLDNGGAALTNGLTNAEPLAENAVTTSQTEARKKSYAINYIIRYVYSNTNLR